LGFLSARFALDTPAGLLEYLGEQRFGASPSFNASGFLGFFWALKPC
jgi:hypothetical protein